jgi:CRISPR-associated protein Csc2
MPIPEGFPSSFEPLAPYLLEQIPILKSAQTVQLIVLRQTHDYAIFRTEETRELNVVTTPTNIQNMSPQVRVVMLASKQKAPENRSYLMLFRRFAEEFEVELEDDVRNCYLKDNLCRKCPRCVLFGAVTTEKRARGEQRWNIKHRIEYSSAYSLERYEDIYELMTGNAVSDVTTSTGRALLFTENVTPIANFPSVISLNSVTPHELMLYLKTLLATKSYGAEGRIKGDVVNYVLGIAAGFEEIITSLEVVLELAALSEPLRDPLHSITDILQRYAENAAFPSRVTIITGDELENFMRDIREYQLTKEDIEIMKRQSASFIKQVEEKAKEE